MLVVEHSHWTGLILSKVLAFDWFKLGSNFEKQCPADWCSDLDVQVCASIPP